MAMKRILAALRRLFTRRVSAVICPECGGSLTPDGNGLYHCRRGCGAWYVAPRGVKAAR